MSTETKDNYAGAVTIRPETSADHDQVARVIEAAFRDEPYSDQQEAALVARLRRSEAFVPELSLVAEADGWLVGHILLTKLTIRNDQRTFPSLALAPVSVTPEYQRRGIGTQLIEEAHQRARTLGYPSVLLIGHEDYYPRFGYQPIHHFGIRLPFEAPEPNCMALALTEGGLTGVSGLAEYPSEFFA